MPEGRMVANVGGRRILAAVAVAALLGAPPARAQTAPVTVSVDAGAGRHAISPLIYGVAFAGEAALADLNSPLNRYGGNATSRYNWQLNADNRANDWYYESIGDDSAVAGERVDTFIARSRSARAQAMVTIPVLDWVAKLGPDRGKLASFSQAKYGAQTGSDAQWFPDAGNGVLRSTGRNVTGNDPADANVANGTALQREWVQHLVARWGTAADGGLQYYVLDNEHSLWYLNHRDVHPTGAKMEEIRQRMIDYASMVRAVDPDALVVGPEEWGWNGYLYSGYDQQYAADHGYCCHPDREAHGNQDYLPWLLDELHREALATGRRMLDVFSVHWYPQGGEFSNDTSPAMQRSRNRSTRSLWDPDYVDPTWIDSKVMLVPRLKGWVAAHYPGLKTAITEYNWGAEGHINGATTQADILGIFGREGLDIATRWTTPDASTPTYKAMKLYRNYDGNHATFGETSVAAAVPNPDELSAFAAIRAADGALTVMVVNKALAGPTPVTVTVTGFTAKATAQAWQLTAANAIERLPDVSIGGAAFAATVPAQSVTLYVLPRAGLQSGTTATVVEFYHAGMDHYFMSALAADIDALDSGRFAGWARTGMSFRAWPTAALAPADASPVCRFYIPPAQGDSHFHSASPAECAQVRASFPSFVAESPNVMYVDLPDPGSGACPAGDAPVYRVWDHRADANHRYTTDPAVRAQMVARGWVAEGYGPDQVAMCAPR